MEPSKEQPKWHDDLMYQLGWQKGKLTDEQMVNVGYALSETPDVILWALENIPTVGDYVRTHLKHKTAMYLAGLDAPTPPPSSVSITPDEPAFVNITTTVAELSGKPAEQTKETAVALTKELQTAEPQPDQQIQQAMKTLFLYACDLKKTRSSFSTEGLTRVKGAENKFVVDETFVKRLGDEVFKAKIQTKKAMNPVEPADKLHGVGLVIRNLMERVNDKDKPPLHFSTTGLNSSGPNRFMIDEKLAKHIGEQVLEAKVETKTALKLAKDALQPSRHRTHKA